MANPIVTFELASGGVIKAELYPEIAPNTVNNFISLVKRGFYDGLTFHRVIPGSNESRKTCDEYFHVCSCALLFDDDRRSYRAYGIEPCRIPVG